MAIQNPPQKLFRGWKQDLADQIQLIYDQGFSTGEVSRRLEVNVLKVKRYLSQMGYEFSQADGSRRSTKSRFDNVELNTKLLEIIEGNLLGDGSITIQKNTSKPHLVPRSAVYAHDTKSFAQIQWLMKLLEDNGLPVRERINFKSACQHEIKSGPNAGTIVNHKDKFGFKSTAQPSLLELREKWYKPKKIIPIDLNLTPIMLLHWYLGDGSLGATKYANYVIFYTYGFTKENVHFLQHRLEEDFGLVSFVYPRSKANNEQYYICLSSKRENVMHFFQTIGPCPPELIADYGHKWPNA